MGSQRDWSIGDEMALTLFPVTAGSAGNYDVLVSAACSGNTVTSSVAVVTVNGRDLGEVMIGSGLAIPQPQFLKADPDRAARYAAVFADAKRRGAGAFGGEWIEPTQWRRGRRLTCER